MAISLASTAGCRVGRMRIDVPSRTRSVTAATCDSVISESSQLDPVEAMGGDDVVGDPQRVEPQLLGAAGEPTDVVGVRPLAAGDEERRQEDAELHACEGSQQPDFDQHLRQRGALVVADPEQRPADVRGLQHAERDETFLEAHPVVADRFGEHHVGQALDPTSQRPCRRRCARPSTRRSCRPARRSSPRRNRSAHRSPRA